MKLILTLQAWMNQWTRSQEIFLAVWTALLLGLSVWAAYMHGRMADQALFWRDQYFQHNVHYFPTNQTK